MDASTGLYFYGAGYYDPLLFRFLAPDRAGPDLANPQSLNKYSYVLNNPVKYTDPTGNRPWDGEPEDDGGVGGDGGGNEGGGDWGGGDGGGGDDGYSGLDDLGLGAIDSGMESPTDSPSLGYGSPTDDVSGSFFPGVDSGGVVGPDTMQLDFGTPDACYFSPLELYNGPKPSDVVRDTGEVAGTMNSVFDIYDVDKQAEIAVSGTLVTLGLGLKFVPYVGFAVFSVQVAAALWKDAAPTVANQLQRWGL